MAFTLDHVHLRSLDPEAAASFYVAMFGARQHASSDAGGSLRCVVEVGGLMIFIQKMAAGGNEAPATPYRGLEHVCFSVTDLDAAAADMTAKGAVFSVPPREARPGVRIAFVTAPDNVSIELVERR